MSEPDNASNEVIESTEELVDIEETEEVETASELAPESSEETEETPKDEHHVNQEKINKVIARKHWEAKKAQEERDEALKRLKAFEEQNPSAPVVPEKPDPFDSDYEVKLKARDDALLARAKWEAEQETQARYAEQQAIQAQQARAQELAQQAKSYSDRAKSFGIEPSELQQYGQAAGQYVSDDLAIAILNDNDGPLLTKYLAQNPMEAMELSQMSPYQAAMHIERTVRPKAQSLKPKATAAPSPTTKVESAATVTTDSPFLKGATFE